VVIIDLKDVSAYGLPVSALKGVISLLGKHYVGRLYQMYVVNAPYLVTGLYSVVKPLLSDRQQNKIIFVSKPQDVFPKFMALHQLDECYGGSKKESSYPFVMPPGPFTAGATKPHDSPLKHCASAVSRETILGRLWERDLKAEDVALPWSNEAPRIFRSAGLDPPENCSGGSPHQVGVVERMSLVGDAMERALNPPKKPSVKPETIEEEQSRLSATPTGSPKAGDFGSRSTPVVFRRRRFRDPNAPFDCPEPDQPDNTGDPEIRTTAAVPPKAVAFANTSTGPGDDPADGTTVNSPATEKMVSPAAARADHPTWFNDDDGDVMGRDELEHDLIKTPSGSLSRGGMSVFDCLSGNRACGLCQPRDPDGQ